MNEIIFIVSEPPEGGYAAEALGQSVFTVADTLEELNEMVRDPIPLGGGIGYAECCMPEKDRLRPDGNVTRVWPEIGIRRGQNLVGLSARE